MIHQLDESILHAMFETNGEPVDYVEFGGEVIETHAIVFHMRDESQLEARLVQGKYVVRLMSADVPRPRKGAIVRRRRGVNLVLAEPLSSGDDQVLDWAGMEESPAEAI